MTRSRILAALFALFILAAFVQSAAAHYDPKLGRWLERDPIGTPTVRIGQLNPGQQYAYGMNLYETVRSRPVHRVDPYGLQDESPGGEGQPVDEPIKDPDSGEVKPAKQCSLNGQPVSFTFDGKTLSGGGISCTAASGKPISKKTDITTINFDVFIKRTYTFDYSEDRQKLKHVGPTVEGNYWVNTCEERSWKTSKDHLLWSRYGWGAFSWSLHPESAKEDRHGRGGFFIHGGLNWGSAGCVDVKDCDRVIHELMDTLRAQNTGCCFVPVAVSYTEGLTTTRDELQVCCRGPYIR